MVSEPDDAGQAGTGRLPEQAVPDAELTDRIRRRAAASTPPVQAFGHRHIPAALAYARLCSRRPAAAPALATHAFSLAMLEIRRGIQPRGIWRHQLLMLVQQTAASWAADGRSDHLAPGLVACLEATGTTTRGRLLPIGARPHDGTMLDAFHSLPERTRIVLWHAVLEAEPDAETAALLATEPDAIAALKPLAQQALHKAYLRAHLQRNGNQTCARFQRLIEATTRPGDLRRSLDLEQHMDTCSCCTLAVAHLFHMMQDPRGALAEGLLGWGSAAYLADTPHEHRSHLLTTRSKAPVPVARAAAEIPAPSAQQTGTPVRHRGHRAALGATTIVTAVAATAAAVAAVALLSGGRGKPEPATPTTQPPLVTTAATTSPSAAGTSASPTAGTSPNAAPSRTQAPSPSPTPASSPKSNVNLALHQTATASSYTQNYVPSNAVDGSTTTYWESANNALPQWFEMDLGSPTDVRTLVMRLPPLADWNSRRQTIAIDACTNGHDCRTVVPATPYTFASSTGNTVTVALGPLIRTRYLKLTFTANTGWPAAQLSELHIFSS
ncbi:hypothetical protein GCM10010317_094250 [Streptomyces mirabilis]|uniref:discoidin domain-containing protein n=1 Tax=Streptomyces mirabilis TaxID=68239 RepID=UPI00167EBCDF|nr:discoidin domain-containing protein [Streptomyces mirabilis]GHD77006.1 hypothetical protein GCM10010317_094250 [Streptomyces mirabilis]